MLARVSTARAGGFTVSDDGSVAVAAAAPPLLIAVSGGDRGVADSLLAVRATELSRQIVEALDRLGAAVADAADDTPMRSRLRRRRMRPRRFRPARGRSRPPTSWRPGPRWPSSGSQTRSPR